MRILQILLFSSFVLLLSSCTSMSKEDCTDANWGKLGYKAATKGEPNSHLEDVSQQCMEYGIRPDRKKYFRGRNAGLKKFCTYESGRDYGYHGNYYRGICPKKLEKDFLRGYKFGKQELALEEQQEELRRQQEEVRRLQEEANNNPTNEKGYNSSNCAHIMADGECAHKLY